MRDRQFDGSEIVLMRSANVLSMDVLDPLLRQPLDDFMIGDNQAAGSFGDFDGIADVVTVTV